MRPKSWLFLFTLLCLAFGVVPSRKVFLPVVMNGVPEATVTPVEADPAVGFVISDTVDLGNGMPTAMSVRTPSGKVLNSTWAKAIAAEDGVDPETAFKFNSGTVFSLKRQFPMLLGHSGSLKGGIDLFAQDLNKEVAYGPSGKPADTAKALRYTNDLIGSEVTLCQSTNPNSPKVLSRYDQARGCPGKVVKLTVTAAAIIEQSKVAEYEGAIQYEWLWLLANEPDGGFEGLVQGKSLLFFTCVNRFSDQPVLKSVPDYVYNRLLLGLTVRE